MTKKAFCCLSLILFLCSWGCSHQEDIPKGIIPVRKMEKILLDLQMCENVVDNNPRVDTSLGLRNLKIKTYYLQILQGYGVSKDNFLTSFKFYESHPDHMKTIFDGMLQDIDRQKQVLDSMPFKPHY